MRAPHARVLPAQCVALGYADGRRVFKVWGRPIPDPLVVGPAPQKGLNADTLATDAAAGWLVDFVKAEAVGMGRAGAVDGRLHVAVDRLPERGRAGRRGERVEVRSSPRAAVQSWGLTGDRAHRTRRGARSASLAILNTAARDEVATAGAKSCSRWQRA